MILILNSNTSQWRAEYSNKSTFDELVRIKNLFDVAINSILQQENKKAKSMGGKLPEMKKIPDEELDKEFNKFLKDNKL